MPPPLGLLQTQLVGARHSCEPTTQSLPGARQLPPSLMGTVQAPCVAGDHRPHMPTGPASPVLVPPPLPPDPPPLPPSGPIVTHGAKPPPQLGQSQSLWQGYRERTSPASRQGWPAGGMQHLTPSQPRSPQQPPSPQARELLLHAVAGPLQESGGHIEQRQTGQISSAKVVSLQPAGQGPLVQTMPGGERQEPPMHVEPIGGQSASLWQVQTGLLQSMWQVPAPSVSVPGGAGQAVNCAWQYWLEGHSLSISHAIGGPPLLEPPDAVDVPELLLEPPEIEKPELLEPPETVELPPLELALDEADEEPDPFAGAGVRLAGASRRTRAGRRRAGRGRASRGRASRGRAAAGGHADAILADGARRTVGARGASPRGQRRGTTGAKRSEQRCHPRRAHVETAPHAVIPAQPDGARQRRAGASELAMPGFRCRRKHWRGGYSWPANNTAHHFDCTSWSAGGSCQSGTTQKGDCRRSRRPR